MKSGLQANWRSITVFLTCLLLLVGPVAPGVSAQELEPTKDPFQVVDDTRPENGTPEATVAPTENVEIPVTTAGTPAAATTPTPRPSTPRVDPAATEGAPATLAHGLAYYDGDDLVWQVQEIQIPLIADADATTGEAGIILQRDGQTIVRNNTTGKRALLNPGDAFFLTTDDSYTIMAEDDGSVAWKFSLVDPDDVASDAFYESPTLTAVNDNTYDLMLVRYVLQPGNSADLPDNSGAGMVMPGAGEVQVDHGGKLSLLGMENNHGQGQMLRQDTTISNTGSAPVVVYYLYLGDTVTDASAAPPLYRASANATNTPASQTTTTSQPATGNTPVAGAPQEPSTSPGDQPEGGPYTTSINVYAETELYLTVTVDGVIWYDGVLPAGQWSGSFRGTSFEVYTNHGAGTKFENACGEYFAMGYEPGEAWYVLEANANSCPPPAQ